MKKAALTTTDDPSAHQWALLPPPPGTCTDCAVTHDAGQPHNQQSLHYQYKFYFQHGRWPTWNDALAHCSDAVKAHWIAELTALGVKGLR